MKITCQKADLVKGVNIVSKAVPTRLTTMTILNCILIDATSGEIKLTANDMEIGIETIIEGNVVERGKIAIDAKKFSDFVRKLPDNEVVIESDSDFNAYINCEGVKSTLGAKSGEEFPDIPNIPRTSPIIISQLTLKDIIRQTIFAVSDSENNKTMTGELIEIKENKLKIVALDGHRVAIRNIELKEETEDVKVIVPKKILNEIIKVLDGGIDDDVNIFVNNNHIIFEFDSTTIISRIIEGEFLRVEQMLSADYETKITINKKRLFESIDRSLVYVNEGEKKPIIVNVNENNFSVSITSVYGKMNEDIDVIKEGKDIMIGFNPKFVLDALRVIDEEDINLFMLNPKSPCFIKDDEGSFVYIVLPINFNSPGASV